MKRGAIGLRSSSDAVLVALWLCLFGTGLESVGCTVRKILYSEQRSGLLRIRRERERMEVGQGVMTYCSFTSSFASLGMI